MIEFEFSNESCQNSEEISNENLAHGVSSLVCLVLLLLPTLILEIYYLCRYKSTFYLRLFLYLTISCMLLTCSFVLHLVLCFYPVPAYCYFIDGATSYALLTELMLILSINIILLYTLGKYARQKKMVSTTRFSHRKRIICEFVFLICQFAIPLMISTIQLVTTVENDTQQCRSLTAWRCQLNNTDLVIETIILIYIPVGLDMLLSIAVLLCLVIWLMYSLKTINLMKPRLMLVCREMSLFIGFLFVFIIFSSAWLASIAFIQTVTLLIIGAVLFPISNVVLLLSFVVYICSTIRGDKRRSSNGPRRANINTVYVATVNPSDRVSLPTDTADHAPNFLSPSTAGPSEVTPLII